MMLSTLHLAVILSVQGDRHRCLFSKRSMVFKQILATCDDVYFTRGLKDSLIRNLCFRDRCYCPSVLPYSVIKFRAFCLKCCQPSAFQI
jgi:hypothetical protein